VVSRALIRSTGKNKKTAIKYNNSNKHCNPIENFKYFDATRTIKQLFLTNLKGLKYQML